MSTSWHSPSRPTRPGSHVRVRQRGEQPRLRLHQRSRRPPRPLAPWRRPEEAGEARDINPSTSSSSPTSSASSRAYARARHPARPRMIVLRQRHQRRQRHNHDDLPILLAGRGAARSRPAGTSATRAPAEQPLPLDARPDGRSRSHALGDSTGHLQGLAG